MPLVGRLDVRVCADDGGHFSVEVPAHGHLLRGGFGVEVNEDDARALAHFLDLLEHDGERIVDAHHENAAHHVDHARPKLADSVRAT